MLRENLSGEFSFGTPLAKQNIQYPAKSALIPVHLVFNSRSSFPAIGAAFSAAIFFHARRALLFAVPRNFQERDAGFFTLYVWMKINDETSWTDLSQSET
jgi:hypothetical protein